MRRPTRRNVLRSGASASAAPISRTAIASAMSPSSRTLPLRVADVRAAWRCRSGTLSGRDLA